MNAEIADRVTRIKIYLERVRRDVHAKDVIQALADAAELNFQTQQLWNAFHRVAKAQNGLGNPVPQLFDQMLCRLCKSQPALIPEILDFNPTIVTWRFECICGSKTNQFYEISKARLSWLEHYSHQDVDPLELEKIQEGN